MSSTTMGNGGVVCLVLMGGGQTYGISEAQGPLGGLDLTVEGGCIVIMKMSCEILRGGWGDIKRKKEDDGKRFGVAAFLVGDWG
jgi:hypothetical protein